MSNIWGLITWLCQANQIISSFKKIAKKAQKKCMVHKVESKLYLLFPSNTKGMINYWIPEDKSFKLISVGICLQDLLTLGH